MSRLASFLTALWLSSAAANPGFIKDKVSGAKDQFRNELQAGLDPVGETLSFIGDGVCAHAKRIVGVAYEDYDDEEPDMSKLTLVYQTSAKTVVYKLEEAAEEIPKESWYDPELPIKLYIHGFTDKPSKDGFQAINSVFAEAASRGEVAILALDASSLIHFFYIRSTTMVHFIGEELGRILVAWFLTGLHPKNIHLIGHSLGSHIAGFAGRWFYLQTGFHIDRISGLDPAGPCFGKLDPDLRLSKGDAKFVDVIHTNAGVFGLKQQIGHVDSWPNGGENQPGCLLNTCSHSRAWNIYVKSVRFPGLFKTVKCNSHDDFRHGKCDYNNTSLMGSGSSPDTRGMYYCQTLAEEPYGAGDEGLTYKETAAVRAVSHSVKDAFSG